MRNYYVKVVGKGKPLIFLPAAGFPGIEGLNIADYLSEDYESHLIDLPGIGRSAGIEGAITLGKIALWLKEYIDNKGWNQVTIVGHSLGGAIAMCFAYCYPNFDSKLILLDQGHKRMSKFPIRDMGLLGVVTPALSLMERIFGDTLAKRLARLFTPKDNSQEMKEKQITYFCDKLHLDKTDYIKKTFNEDIKYSKEGIRLFFRYYRLNLPKILENLNVPTLLLYASFKGINKKEASRTEKMVLKIKKNNQTIIKKIDTHHFLHWSDDNTLEEIKEFLV